MQSELVQSQKSLFSHYPTNLTEQSSFSKATSQKVKKFPSQHVMEPVGSLLCSQEPVLSQTKSSPSSPISLRTILILASCPHYVFYVISLPMISPSKHCMNSLLPHVWHVPHPSHSSWPNNPNNIYWGTQIMKCLKVLFSSVSITSFCLHQSIYIYTSL